MNLKLISLLFGLALVAGCATYVGPPEPVVYYGWYGEYYGPYWWGPSGVVVYGNPPHWGGHYYYGPHFYYRGAPAPHGPPPHGQPHGHSPQR